MGHDRISVMVGNTMGIVGTIFALYLSFIAQSFQSDLPRLFLYLLSFASFVFFPHCLAHFLVGRIVGVRFRYYFLGKSGVTKLHLPLISRVATALPILTLKVDKSSLSSVSRGRRAAMFASGAVASMWLPVIPTIISLGQLPVTQSVLLIMLAGLNVAFDLYYSPKAGDMSRARSSLLA